MWEKTCKSQVENSAYFDLSSKHSLAVLGGFGSEGSLQLSQSTAARAQLNLETDLDVGSDEPQVCIRMHVPGFPVK